MTDARLPERFLADRRFLMLSAEDFRAYCFALMYAVSNRTEGFIQPDDLQLIPRFGAEDPAALVAAGVWIVWGHGWYIDDYEFTQSTVKELEATERKRLKDRVRQAAYRAAQKSKLGDDSELTDETAPDHDVTRDKGRDLTRDIKGQARARLGQAKDGDQLEKIFATLGPELDTQLHRTRAGNALRRGMPAAEVVADIQRFARHKSEIAS